MSISSHQLQGKAELEQTGNEKEAERENKELQEGEGPEKGKQQPKLHKFAAGPWLTEFMLRSAALVLWKLHFINGWIFWIVQIALYLVYLNWALDKESAAKKEGIKIKKSGLVFLLGFILFAVSAVVNYNLFPQLHTVFKMLITIPFSLLYALLLYTIHGVSIGNAISEQTTNVSSAENEKLTYEEKGDINDLQIIELESKIAYINSKVDTYVLESALFGALAFSGFLTLVSADRVKFESFVQLFNMLGRLWEQLLAFRFGEIPTFIAGLDRTLLLNAVVLESLICTMFFLSVIASRLRFSDSLEHIDLHVRAARSFNEKEEEILIYLLENEPDGPTPRVEERLRKLNTRIASNVREATSKLDKLGPVTAYMKGFRNAGIMAFLLTIVTGAFLVSKGLAVLFTVMSVAAFLYSNIDHSLRIRNFRIRSLLDTTNRIKQLSKKAAE